VPKSEAARVWAHQLQLTVADWLVETHDAHHRSAAPSTTRTRSPIEAPRGALHRERLPKFFGYFEKVLGRERGGWLLGKTFSYADISFSR